MNLQPATATPKDRSFKIGAAVVAGQVLAAPMTGITDLPFRRLLRRLGATYVATEMLASAELARGRPDVVRRGALDPDADLKIVQIVGRDAGWMAAGARLARDAGADVIDINMGCPAREVAGAQCGSALMRDLDAAVDIITAVVDAVDRPVTVKMRLGWDESSRNAPDLAARAQAAGAQAITVHGRTRQQFYKGEADWAAVAQVRQATTLPLVVNGDIRTAAQARAALDQSGADAVMVGRGFCGQPWQAAALQAELSSGLAPQPPGAEARLQLVLAHMEETLKFYGDRLGQRIFRKHLGWYVEAAPWPAHPQERRAAKARICSLETPGEVEAQLERLWLHNND